MSATLKLLAKGKGGGGSLHEACINQKAKESYKWSLECRKIHRVCKERGR